MQIQHALLHLGCKAGFLLRSYTAAPNSRSGCPALPTDLRGGRAVRAGRRRVQHAQQ